MSRDYCLHLRCAPGDHVVLTSLPRDLHRVDPTLGVYVDSPFPDVYLHNPYVRPGPAPKSATWLRMDYGRGMRRAEEERVHFAAWFHRDFETNTGIHVPVTEPNGDLHFGPAEAAPAVPGRYWAILPGGKTDFPLKMWAIERFQAVADAISALGIGVVRLGAGSSAFMINPPMTGVVDLLGATSLRDMFRVIRDAEGVICGVTCAMHVAAALHKPCIVLGGGREPWWWEAYVNENGGFGPLASGRVPVPHRFLHAIGALECCETVGCRRQFFEGSAPKTVCVDVRETAKKSKIPACLDLVTTERVIAAVLSYYLDDTLPPPPNFRTEAI